MCDPILKEVHNSYGQHYWIAMARIGSIFGSEVEGELKAIGPTKEIALDRLNTEREKLYQSLQI